MEQRTLRHRYYRQGCNIFVACYEVFGGSFLKIAGSDTFIRSYPTPQEAEENLKALHKAIIEREMGAGRR